MDILQYLKINMKIKLLDGCSYSLEIDGTEFIELTPEKQQEVCHKLIDKVSESTLQKFIESTCYEIGTFEDLGHCDTCGAWNERYTVII